MVSFLIFGNIKKRRNKVFIELLFKPILHKKNTTELNERKKFNQKI